MKRSTTETLSIIVVSVCCFRFLFDGMDFTIWGQNFTLSHVDSGAYASFMAPILAAHSWIRTKGDKNGNGIPDKLEGKNE